VGLGGNDSGTELSSWRKRVRLNRYLALCGVASRRKCDDIILSGNVAVNDVVCKELATLINPKKDKVSYNGEILKVPVNYSYYILNKPAGYITSSGDPHNRKTVYSLLKDVGERVFHVGRLDQDSKGLLLFTNDGKMAHRLLHPKYEVPKEYLLTVNGFLSDESISMLEKGIVLEEGKTKEAIIKLIRRKEKESEIRITISQGWKRQIRRMVEAIGLGVKTLRRETFGCLSLSDLEEGGYRKLTVEEINALKRLVKLP